MKYVACYCRVSTDEQKKFGFSIQAQKDALKKYCEENKYKYEFYIDEGISASSMKRPALQAMLKKINEFDLILFTKLDRLSRNVLDANNINKLLIENNCTMKAIDEDDIDTSTADGTFIFNLKVSLAQREIGKTSERIKFVFQNKREKGEVTSGTCKYGYDIVDKRFVVNEFEAENIRNLYKEFVNNNGNLKETYEYFVKNFKNKGYYAFKNYLKETAYIGKYKLYRKDIYIDNYIPPIMDIDLFNKVQSLLKRKTFKRDGTTDDLFAGILYCSKCKKRFAKKTDLRTKNLTIRYYCYSAAMYNVGTIQKKCDNNKMIREPYIENYLLENLFKEIKNYILKNDIININKKANNNTSKIKTLNKKLEKLKDLYIDDLIDKETYKKDYKKYKDEINELQKNDTTTISKNYEHLSKILNSNYKDIYSNLNRKNKKRFWLSIIDKIYINNGEIEEIIFL